MKPHKVVITAKCPTRVSSYAWYHEFIGSVFAVNIQLVCLPHGGGEIIAAVVASGKCKGNVIDVDHCEVCENQNVPLQHIYQNYFEERRKANWFYNAVVMDGKVDVRFNWDSVKANKFAKQNAGRSIIPNPDLAHGCRGEW